MSRPVEEKGQASDGNYVAALFPRPAGLTITARISTVPIMNARLKGRVKNTVASPAREQHRAPQVLLHQRPEHVAENQGRGLAFELDQHKPITPRSPHKAHV